MDKPIINISIEKLVDKIEVQNIEKNLPEIEKLIIDCLSRTIYEGSKMGMEGLSSDENLNNKSMPEPTFTTNVNTVELDIKTNTLEEAIAVIAKELRKHPNGYRFHGSLIGFAKSEPYVLTPDNGDVAP